MRSVLVDLTISADEYLKHYQHSDAQVLARSRDGRTVRFPAKILQPFITHSGIAGSFRILFDNAGKFAGIDRLVNPE